MKGRTEKGVSHNMNLGDIQKLLGAIQIEDPGNIKELRLNPFDYIDTREEVFEYIKNLNIKVNPDVSVDWGIIRVIHTSELDNA